MEKDGCCPRNCLKNALNFFNLLFLFVAFGLLAVTIWTLNRHYDLINLLTSSTYSVLIYFLIGAGALLLLVSFLGCWSVLHENRRTLVVYIFLLLLIVLMEVMVAFLGYIYKENVNNDLKTHLSKTMLESYKVDMKKTEAIDLLQQEFSCCGALQFEDWRKSLWIMSNMTKNLVPDSCCKTMSVECGIRDHPSNINYDGCLNKMDERLKNSLIIIICVGLGVAISQIIGIILAIKLYFSLKEGIDRNELRSILHNT